MEHNRWLKVLIALLAIIAGWYLTAELWALAERFSDIILLFFLAWVLAFMLSPLARRLRRHFGMSRAGAVIVVYLGLVVVILSSTILLIPVVTDQLSQLGAVVASYGDKLPEWTAGTQAELQRRGVGIDLAGFYREQGLSAQIERLGTLAIQNAIGVATGIASTMFGVILVLVLSFYIMIDGGRLLRQVLGALPLDVRNELQFLLDCVDHTFGGFMRGQLFQCAIYGLGTAAIMFGSGLNYVLVSSLFAGIVMLVPFFGPVLAIVPPLLIASLQGSLAKFVVVGLLLLVLQQVVINLVAPKVLSAAVGLPPLLVILAMLLGAKLAGLVGAIFGVPVAAVAYAMLVALYQRSSLSSPPALPSDESTWTAPASEDDGVNGESDIVVPPAPSGRRLVAWLARLGFGN